MPTIDKEFNATIKATNNIHADVNAHEQRVPIEFGRIYEVAETNYHKFSNKPKINGYELDGDVSLIDLGIDLDSKADKSELNNYVKKENGKGLSSNDFTDELKEKVVSGAINGKDGRDGVDGKDGKDGVSIAGPQGPKGDKGDTYTITEADYQAIANKVTVTYNDAELRELISGKADGNHSHSQYLTSEADPTVPSHVKAITQANITSWNNKSNFSGSYNDLTNKPTIPSAYDDSDIRNLINAKADKEHTHGANQIMDVADLPFTVIKNAYISESNGSKIGYNGWDMTDYVDVSGCAYIFTNVRGQYNAWYKADKTFLSKANIQAEQTTVPSGAKYLRLSNTATQIANMTLRGSGEDIASAISTLKNSIPTIEAITTDEIDEMFAPKGYKFQVLYNIATNQVKVIYSDGSEYQLTQDDRGKEFNGVDAVYFRDADIYGGNINEVEYSPYADRRTILTGLTTYQMAQTIYLCSDLILDNVYPD